MKTSIRLPGFALLLVAAACSSDGTPGGSPDAAAPACAADLLPAVVDSVVVGSTPPTNNAEDVVAWGEGEDVELIYGGQGSLMLVAEVVAHGSGLTEDLTYPEGELLPGYLPFELSISMEGWGVVVQRNYPSNFVVHAEDGSWYWETLLLPFELALPAEGEALDMRLTLGCFEIQRTLIAHLPEE